MALILKIVSKNVLTTNRLPDNQQIAILKLLPKTENPRTVEEFRPISLLNTDLKILLHVLANRLIKNLEKVIGQHQHAYQNKRQINAALMKVRKAHRQRTNSKCIVNLVFAKAFEK